MRIHPTDSLAMQLVCSYERNYILMRYGTKLVDKAVRLQQFTSSTGIADQQLTINEVMSGSFVPIQQTVQLRRKGHPIGEKSNPDGGIYEYH